MLLRNTDCGLYCPAGDFYIDPWRPVDYAVITHAHSDHARWGSRHYLVTDHGSAVFRARLGPDAKIETLPYGKSLVRNGVKISFHPAGHILGSSQIRIEYLGEVCVVSGDYKLEPDGTCAPFEPVRCHMFVTESTFGLPIYRWRPQSEVFAEINEWWLDNQQKDRTSVLFGYSLGKAQRLLHGVDLEIGPIAVHGAVDTFLPFYREAGIKLPETTRVDQQNARALRGKGLVIAPPSAHGTPWMRKFGECSTAFASGWMQIRGTRRRRALDRGFVLSDHIDWNDLLRAIKETSAETIWVTHGYTGPVVRWLRENGWQAEAIKTRFEGETDSEGETMSVATESKSGSPASAPAHHADEPDSRVTKEASTPGDTNASRRHDIQNETSAAPDTLSSRGTSEERGGERSDI